MGDKIKINTALEVTLHAAATSLPMPTLATQGADVTSWRDDRGGFAYEGVRLSIVPSAACDLAGPVGLYAYDGAAWELIGTLNNGQDIVLGSATTGWADDVSAGAFQRVAIGGVYSETSGAVTITPTNGASVTVKAAPIERV